MVVAAFSRAFSEHFPDLLGRPLLVALSGGSDSVALLHLLAACREDLGCAVHAAHVHHHVRGAEADLDVEFCESLCGAVGLPLAVEHLDPRPPRGVSHEAWWRRERYRLLREACRRAGCAAVATAHTADDQAETVLLKLLRGAGPRGVAGIRRRTGDGVRPLLDFRRDELREWLAGRGASWRDDMSNASLDRPRGWLRHEVLPLLSSRAPHAVRHLAAFAGTLADDDALLSSLLRERASWPAVGAPIRLTLVSSLPPPLLRRWVLELAARLPLAEPPSRRQLEAVEAMVRGGGAGGVDLGRRWVLRRCGGELALSPPPCHRFGPIAARFPSETSLPGGFIGRLGRSDEGARHRARLAARVADARLAWRSLRPGERLGGARRAARVELARTGVPPEWRAAWPVLEADGTMVWVPGVGVCGGWETDAANGIVAEMEEPWRRSGRW